ncbi:protein kinase, partial [Myxococcota bacterium]|nr:protein kinase [Myxococcota bacterium]
MPAAESSPGPFAGDARPAAPKGAVRRLALGLLEVKLFGHPAPRLGRFEVRRKLGEGAMGAVFEALDPTLGRVVALKVIQSDHGFGPLADISLEARLHARLSHPNVVTVYELGVEDGEPYVCMERVDGPHLAAWLLEHPEAPWAQRVRLLLEAARGLAAAHRAGVIHRDFKLENVLVGSDGSARVTDFGLAQAGPARSGATELARAPSIDRAPSARVAVGTPGYIAPEVERGAPADERSDQYSFFVSLRAALRGAPSPPPAAIDALITQGTHADPTARHADMATVVALLESVLARPVAAPEQRARDVLAERVHHLWVEPVRGHALLTQGFEVPLRSELAPELGAREAPALGDGGADELARTLDALLAGIVLVGPPGGGKTLRLLEVADALLRRARDRADAVLPVVLNLSSYPAFRGTMSAWLTHELVAKYALPRGQAEAWLEAGQLALLLDGLDEVDAADRVATVTALNTLRATRPTPYLVTCREENYRALSTRLEADAVLRLRPLDAAAVEAALVASGAPPRIVRLVQEDAALAEQLHNPL